jgi:hypothetical protein
MAVPKAATATTFNPNRSHRAAYDTFYREYRRLGDFLARKPNQQE